MAIKKIYNVKYTDNTKTPIKVPRRIFVKDIADITLIGKRTLEYGQEFNETLLHLMESFSCPSAPDDTHNPDPDSKIYGLLVNPLEGQLWYNSTTECLHVWDGTHWDEFITYNAVHGNSGFINDGEYVPIPTNQFGYYHKIEDCAISVSPYFMNAEVESFECSVDSAGKVTAKYTPIGGVQQTGLATYAILCNGLCYPEPPPVFLLSVTPEETVLNRFESVILTATVNGDPDGHTFAWLQTSGSPVTINYIDQFTVEIIANASIGGELLFDFVIDPYTDKEQRMGVSIFLQLGEIGYLTSHIYGINKIVENVTPGLTAYDGILKEPPAPYEFSGEEDSTVPMVMLRGGLLWDSLLSFTNKEEITPSLELTGGQLKLSLLETGADESIAPELSITGGILKLRLIETNEDEAIEPFITLTGGQLY